MLQYLGLHISTALRAALMEYLGMPTLPGRKWRSPTIKANHQRERHKHYEVSQVPLSLPIKEITANMAKEVERAASPVVD